MLPSARTYNIPVCVWLEESYPQTGPLCYVKPTSEMVIMRSQYVSSNGEVLLPCLDQWKAVSMNHCCSLNLAFSGVTSVSTARVSVTWWACCRWWSPCLKTFHQYVCGFTRSLCRLHVSTASDADIKSSILTYEHTRWIKMEQTVKIFSPSRCRLATVPQTVRGSLQVWRKFVSVLTRRYRWTFPPREWNQLLML